MPHFSQLDLSSKTRYYGYFITWTPVTEFCDDFPGLLAKWHVKKCDMALLVSEGGPGTDKHLHYHSIGMFKNKQGAGVKRMCETLYGKFNMEVERSTIKVEEITELYGLFWYLTKDLEGPPILIIGWQMSWIKQKCLENLKKMPHKMLLKDQAVLTPKTAVPLIIEYANRKGLLLDSKLSFRDCLKQMSKDKWRLVAIWPKITIICAEVLMQCGNDYMFDQVFDSAFFGLE